MQKRVTRLLFILALITNANPAAFARGIPKSLAYSIDPQWFQKLSATVNIMEQVSEELRLQKLPKELSKKLLPVHFVAMNSQYSKGILGLSGVRVASRFRNVLFEESEYSAYHFEIGQKPFVLFFVNLSRAEIQKVTNRIKSYSTISPLKIKRSLASEVKTAETNPPAVYTVARESLNSLWGCAEGLSDLIANPFVNGFYSAKKFFTDNKAFTDASVAELKAIWAYLTHPVDSVKRTLGNYRDSTVRSKSRTNCGLVGSAGIYGALSKASRLSGYPNRVAKNAKPMGGSVASKVVIGDLSYAAKIESQLNKIAKKDRNLKNVKNELLNSNHKRNFLSRCVKTS